MSLGPAAREGAGQPVQRADVVVIGAGIVGLATALRLLEQRPDLRIVVLEKEATIAAHQSGHSSGVLHAGLYYRPGSLKARLCREGKADLEDYCATSGIAVEHPGKLVVAVHPSEFARLEAVRERAMVNGVPGLEVVGPERMAEIEPQAAGLRALWSPATGVVDFGEVCLALARDIRGRGADIETDRAVSSVARRGRHLSVGTSRGR